MRTNQARHRDVFKRPDAASRGSGSSRLNVGSTERLASTIGGALATYAGLRRLGRPDGIALTVTGGALFFRGVTGYCPINHAVGRNTARAQRPSPVEIATSLTVYRPREEVYRFWRELENLPRFMRHLQKVRQINGRLSHWEARAPKDMATLAWDAEIVTDEPGRRLAWRSRPGAHVDNAGEVRFEDAPGERGTEVHVRISYRPPAGRIGKAVARLFNPAFEGMVKEDIRAFKHLMEAGEVPVTEGQPSGR